MAAPAAPAAAAPVAAIVCTHCAAGPFGLADILCLPADEALSELYCGACRKSFFLPIECKDYDDLGHCPHCNILLQIIEDDE